MSQVSPVLRPSVGVSQAGGLGERRGQASERSRPGHLASLEPSYKRVFCFGGHHRDLLEPPPGQGRGPGPHTTGWADRRGQAPLGQRLCISAPSERWARWTRGGGGAFIARADASLGLALGGYSLHGLANGLLVA